MNVESGQEEYREAQGNKVSHENMACDLLGAVSQYDNSDEWSQMRIGQVVAEATAHAMLANAEATRRLAEAMETFGTAWKRANR